MGDTVDTEEQAEALVDTLQIDATHLTDANLSGLSSSDLEQLADLEAELCMDSTDIVEGIEVKQMLDNDIVETEIGVQEEEIETEEIDASELPQDEETEEILPDLKDQNPMKVETSSNAPPPLRPLTIAPKPTQAKVPFTLKTALVNTGSGQQIVFIQSPGGTANAVNIGGQPVKLVSAQGQPVTIPGFQNVAIANTKQNVVQLRQGAKAETPNETKKIATPQNKNIVAKVILGGQQQQVVLTSQASEVVQQQQIKLVAHTTLQSPTVSTATKTITLAQAQQMGLITTTNKVQQIVPQSPTKASVVNKTVQGKTIKVVPQVKSPTKILPAPAQGQKVQTPKGTQRVIIRQGNQIKGGTLVGSGMNQVIRIPASQALTPGQIHQINVPGKGVQYIRFMATTSATTNTTTTTSTVTTAKTVTATASPQKSQQPVPVALQMNRQGQANNVVKSPTSTGNVIKVVPISSTQARPVAPKPVLPAQRILIPATNTQKGTGQTLATIPASALSQLQGALLPSGNNLGQIVMLPAQVVQQLQNQTQSSPSLTIPTPKVAVTPKSVPQKIHAKVSPTQAKENITSIANEIAAITNPESSFTRTMEPNGIRPRKPCNCQKSLCLKLYCDCFANGEFCHLCNCMNCFNNLEKEEERQRAIRNCLERNPNAFRPKIGKGKEIGESSIRKHTKGCNCKRSGCLKNYCECYEAKIACSSNCKCIGCQNIEDSMEKKNVRALNTSAEQVQVVPTAKVSKLNTSKQDIVSFRQLLSNSSTKLPSNYITQDVIEATNLCMIAQADEAEKNMEGDEFGKKQILEEFGRCLVEIIECSTQANQNT